MITLRSLECLVALADTGSVTAAAASLTLSQPALSHQIATLERELATPVVERLGRGVRMTAAGRAAAEEARVALAAAGRAVSVGRRVGEGSAGELRIGSVETMTAWVLIPVLRAWRARRPDVILQLNEFTSSDRMVAEMTTGSIDVAVGPEPTDIPPHAEVLGEEEIVVVAPSGHGLASLPTVPLAALSGEPFVHYHPDNGLSSWVDQLAARHDLRLRPVLRTRSPRTAAQLAAAGMGVTLVPVSALGRRPAGAVRRLRPALRRDVLVMSAAPSDALATHFVNDLRHRGLPAGPNLTSGRTSAPLG